jgi:hypothetical protein
MKGLAGPLLDLWLGQEVKYSIPQAARQAARPKKGLLPGHNGGYSKQRGAWLGVTARNLTGEGRELGSGWRKELGSGWRKELASGWGGNWGSRGK